MSGLPLRTGLAFARMPAIWWVLGAYTVAMGAMVVFMFRIEGSPDERQAQANLVAVGVIVLAGFAALSLGTVARVLVSRPQATVVPGFVPRALLPAGMASLMLICVVPMAALGILGAATVASTMLPVAATVSAWIGCTLLIRHQVQALTWIGVLGSIVVILAVSLPEQARRVSDWHPPLVVPIVTWVLCSAVCGCIIRRLVALREEDPAYFDPRYFDIDRAREISGLKTESLASGGAVLSVNRWSHVLRRGVPFGRDCMIFGVTAGCMVGLVPRMLTSSWTSWNAWSTPSVPADYGMIVWIALSFLVAMSAGATNPLLLPNDPAFLKVMAQESLRPLEWERFSRGLALAFARLQTRRLLTALLTAIALAMAIDPQWRLLRLGAAMTVVIVAIQPLLLGLVALTSSMAQRSVRIALSGLIYMAGIPALCGWIWLAHARPSLFVSSFVAILLIGMFALRISARRWRSMDLD